MSMSAFEINFLSFDTNNIFAMSLRNNVNSMTKVISNASSEIFLFKMHDIKCVVNSMNEKISKI